MPAFAEEGEAKNGGMLVNMSPMLEGEAFHVWDGERAREREAFLCSMFDHFSLIHSSTVTSSGRPKSGKAGSSKKKDSNVFKMSSTAPPGEFAYVRKEKRI